MPLNGDYQKINAAISVLTVMQIQNDFNNHTFLLGLKNVIINTSLAGRYEFYHNNPDIIFDSAHNPDGVRKFLSEFSKHSSNYKKKFLLFSALNDKAYRIMRKELRNECENIYLTSIQNDRAASIEDLSETCNNLKFNVKIIKHTTELMNVIKNVEENDCLIVLGSMYLLGKVKTELLRI